MQNHTGTGQEKSGFCTLCGAKMPAGAAFCPACGHRNASERAAAPASAAPAAAPDIIIQNNIAVPGKRLKNKWVAFLLCLFLGGFGAHKFYEGKPVMGILYLLTGGLFGIGWLVDCILLLFKPNPYFV